MKHCQRGHPFDEENTYTSPAGKRRCKACATWRGQKMLATKCPDCQKIRHLRGHGVVLDSEGRRVSRCKECSDRAHTLYLGGKKPYRCQKCGEERLLKEFSRSYQHICRRCDLDGRSSPLLKDPAWLADAYEQMNAAQISRRLGCTPSTVGRWLRIHGIRVRTASEGLAMTLATKSTKNHPSENRRMVTGGAYGTKGVLHAAAGYDGRPRFRSGSLT